MSAQCTVFNLFFDSVKEFLGHLQIHTNVSNVKFRYFYPQCNQTWKSYSSIKKHIAQFHKHQVTKVCYDSVQHGSVKCNQIACNETFALRSKLLSHLKKHIKSGTTVQRPIDSCERKF